jgi:hypothetical protein
MAPGQNKIELWDDNESRWQRNYEDKDMADYVRTELRERFGLLSVEEGDVSWKPPPAPLEQDAFCKKVAQCIVQYRSNRHMPPLDAPDAVRGKLLFKDGMVWDFEQGMARRARPEDRLYRHCPVPLPHWDAPPAIKAKAKLLARKVKAFYLAGGKDLNPPAPGDIAGALAAGAESDEVKSLRNEVCKLFDELIDKEKKHGDHCKMLRGLWQLYEDNWVG